MPGADVDHPPSDEEEQGFRDVEKETESVPFIPFCMGNPQFWKLVQVTDNAAKEAAETIQNELTRDASTEMRREH